MHSYQDEPSARGSGTCGAAGRPGRLLAFALALAAAVIWIPGAAEAITPRPTLTLATSSTVVKVGRPVTVTGAVKDLRDGATTVTILERAGTRWKNVATTDIGDDGRFAAEVTPGAAGTWRLLAQYKAGKLRVRSPVLRLEVIGVPGVWALASAGGSGTAAVAGDGSIWTWGADEGGRLGLGAADEGPHPAPAQVTADSAWVAASAGEDHTLALRDDGTLWAWGGDAEGQAGSGEATTTVGSPARVGDGHDWAAVAAGRHFSLGLREDGTLWAWGANGNGQLGLGDGSRRTSPTRVGIDADWTAVAAGWNHAAALKRDGTLWTWGFNGNGQLGLGDTRSRSVPTCVIGDTRHWKTVSCGKGFTLAVSAGAELLSWGYNGNGQLGLGDAVQRLVPARVGTRTDWTAVSGGGYHGLALRRDGTLWAFGWNGLGQLGVGDADDRTSPAQVGADTGWTAVSAGAAFSLAVREDGSLLAWGDNDLGQLGLGDTEPRDAPAQVGPPEG